MEILIKTELLGTLDTLSTERGMTASEYVEGFVNAHLVSQLKAHITNKIINEQITDIIRIDDAITMKKEEITVERASLERTPKEIIVK